MASNLSCSQRGISATVVHRYQFSSSLKRMSVVVRTTFNKKTSWFLFCKGAPEVLGEFLVEVPQSYESTYLHHMKAGRRVIAMTYRLLENHKTGSIMPRVEAESNLSFLGFLVFNSALKPSTKSVIRELRGTNTPIAIVTGDNVYTAADVARKLNLISSDMPLLLSEEYHDDRQSRAIHWSLNDSSDSTSIPFDVSTHATLSLKYVLCVSGSSLALMESTMSLEEFKATLRHLCPHVRIFSRVSPAQKELITKALNLEGYYTLFCGDGTNDCGKFDSLYHG